MVYAGVVKRAVRELQAVILYNPRYYAVAGASGFFVSGAAEYYIRLCIGV